MYFKFHKGAIRTGRDTKDKVEYSYFNSIKVRLERRLRMTAPKLASDFNSIKVRLEHVWVVHQLRVASFQFHKGAIRTLSSVIRKAIGYYFNSIKVRLELSTSLF